MTCFPLRRVSICLLLVPALALTACGADKSGPRSAGTVAPPAAAPLDTVIDLLNQGDEKAAQKQLKGLLKAYPGDARIRVLAESIDADPDALLGAKSFPYTVQPGDTMIGLSQRFLGNRLKFYQLARYNKVGKPVTLTAGTVLRIPGEAAAPSVKPEPASVETPRPKLATKIKPKTLPAPAVAPVVSASAPVANPAAALRLRSLGLDALNQGKVADAVGLLRRAASLDPANSLIARDLARAERIAQAVRAHR